MIAEKGEIRICKAEFKVAGTDQPRYGSRNRCIVSVNNDNNLVKTLLLYHKNHLVKGNETAKWRQIIRDNYPE